MVRIEYKGKRIMEEIRNEDDGWWVTRTPKDGIYIYEFWHKPVKDILPNGRYIKYVQEGNELVIIEDGPYLGISNV